MSKSTAQTFPVVHYTRLSDLFQEVLRETADSLPPTVHVEALDLDIGGWRVWGVLITALPDTTIHAAWVTVGSAASKVLLSPHRQGEAKANQSRLYMRMAAYAEKQGFTIRPGAYVVPDATFRFSAALPEDLSPSERRQE